MGSAAGDTPLDPTTITAQVKLLVSAGVPAFLSHSIYRTVFAA
jgi:hypothetical protein